MATNVKYKVYNGTTWEEYLFPVATHSHSDYAPKASPTFTGTVDASGATLKIKTINAPTSSGGTTYGAGTSGYVLKSNGSTIYWASDNSNSNYYPIRSYTSGLKISSYSGSTNCELYVPNATTNQAGVITTGAQTFAGDKTFTGIASFDNGIEIDEVQNNYIKWYNQEMNIYLRLNPQFEAEDDCTMYFPSELLSRNSGGEFSLGGLMYRHAIEISSSKWGTSATSQGSTSKTVSFYIYTTDSTKATNLTGVLSLLNGVGATSLSTALLAKTTTASNYGDNCVYRQGGAVICSAYKASSSATTFTYNYLQTLATSTVSDTVTVI